MQTQSRSHIQTRPTRESDAESLRLAINSVAAEKWFLATVDGFTLEETRAFVKRIVDHSLPQVVAVRENQVVGWCDILPDSKIGTSHVGHLGMGVVREWRRHGLGRRLLAACISLARNAGMEKVELEVYSDNSNAIRLYESLDFKREGVRARARKLEGRYQDILQMALPLNWF